MVDDAGAQTEFTAQRRIRKKDTPTLYNALENSTVLMIAFFLAYGSAVSDSLGDRSVQFLVRREGVEPPIEVPMDTRVYLRSQQK
ncbi:MAG: hypothetical protein JO033_05060 [Acidobacteriaceae bacterium]|nr:hypothetical protein [Acidobacteriaceae bacterium]MBV9502125.1 hypothetical protein [Acidobacteriaceae bacterium]